MANQICSEKVLFDHSFHFLPACADTITAYKRIKQGQNILQLIHTGIQFSDGSTCDSDSASGSSRFASLSQQIWKHLLHLIVWLVQQVQSISYYEPSHFVFFAVHLARWDSYSSLQSLIFKFANNRHHNKATP